MNDEMIRALNANTAALHEHTDAMNKHSAMLAAQAEEIKALRRFLERLTEDYKNGGHIGAKEFLDRLGKSASRIERGGSDMYEASKRMSR